jgi:hypothetical protein
MRKVMLIALAAGALALCTPAFADARPFRGGRGRVGIGARGWRGAGWRGRAWRGGAWRGRGWRGGWYGRGWYRPGFRRYYRPYWGAYYPSRYYFRPGVVVYPW